MKFGVWTYSICCVDLDSEIAEGGVQTWYLGFGLVFCAWSLQYGLLTWSQDSTLGV